MSLVSEPRLGHFLDKILGGYSQSVQYHNDLHGADVMQAGHYLIRHGQMHEVLNLNALDCLSFLIAAVAHDIGHDGFTNSYHVNAVTSRSIEVADRSVQETFHAAELFRILSDETCNIVENFSKEEFKLFRKRVVGMILATDMASHGTNLAELQKTVKEN